MSRNIDQRLSSLQARRTGTDTRSFERLGFEAKLEVLAKSLAFEPWQRRAASQPHTRYALGAMQAVSTEYTRISVETANRVGKQLENRLSMPVEFRLQGSVPLDVHIRGVSDVDLLVLDTNFLTYALYGPGSLAGQYRGPPAQRGSLDVLKSLRSEAEKALKIAYPAADVDCSGGKCIALSGGSLARPVDVVPSHWWDTFEYQAKRQEKDRGVTILNKKIPETTDNLPFLHIDRIDTRDQIVIGGLKKAIRLAKNVKNDAENEAGAAQLPSFDIAGLLYHADQATLRSGYFYELAILLETQRFFDWCYQNPTAARALRTPDDRRNILDTDAKFAGLRTISCELDKLARAVTREQLPILGQASDPSWLQIDDTLRKVLVPAAP